MKRTGEHHHAYATGYAVEFRLDTTADKQPTVCVDGAKKTGRHYDWDHKINFQFQVHELVPTAATLLGLQTTCAFRNHGAQRDKHLELTWQGPQCLIKVGQTQHLLCVVPLNPSDVFFITALVMRQLQCHAPELDGYALRALLQSYSRQMQHPSPAQAAS